MTHDFARQRTARANRAAKPAAPPWQWFVTGLVTGTLLSFLVYLATIAPLSTPVARPETAGPTPPAAATEAAQPSATHRPQFDFYTILPESEVIVGERPAAQADSPKDAATAQKPRADNAKPPGPETAPPPPVEVPEPAVLMLQAGSFRQFADADRRRADIILLGYPARVETVTTASGESWSRVQVGPFSDAKALGEARGALRDQGIDTLEIGKRG
jgi:cell division protein FtsN